MLSKIELRIPGDSAVTTMDVSAPKASTRYLVTDVNGLGPVKATVSTSNLTVLDGASLDSVRTGLRNIVIEFEYRPDFASGQSVYSLRQALYKVAGSSRTVELTFVVDGVGSRKIIGTVESLESPMFSKDLTGQMSVICTSPYFIGAEKQVTLTPTISQVVNYEGDVPAGIKMGYTLPVAAQDMRFRRSNPATGWQELRVRAPMSASTGLMYNTIDREKYAKTWAGVNLIPSLTVLDWWKLYPGNNTIILSGTQAVGGAMPNQGTYTVDYQVLYGGL